MKVKTRKSRKNIALVHRNLLLNRGISLEAKGLCSFLEFYSDEFEIAFQTICDRNNKSPKTIRKYIKELENNSYIYRFQNIHTCEIIWYIDSETLDYSFVFSDIKKQWKAQQIRHLTDWQFVASENLPGEKFPTYKNTNTQEYTLHDAKAGLNYLSEVEKSKNKKKYGKGHTINPRNVPKGNEIII